MDMINGNKKKRKKNHRAQMSSNNTQSMEYLHRNKNSKNCSNFLSFKHRNLVDAFLILNHRSIRKRWNDVLASEHSLLIVSSVIIRYQIEHSFNRWFWFWKIRFTFVLIYAATTKTTTKTKHRQVYLDK